MGKGNKTTAVPRDGEGATKLRMRAKNRLNKLRGTGATAASLKQAARAEIKVGTELGTLAIGWLANKRVS